jgi:hypothetical protein
LHAFVENAPVGVIDAFGLAVAALEPKGHGTFLGLPLVTVEGPMQTPPGGAGVGAPGPINENQNCGSVTFSVDKPVQWPHTAEMPGDFAKAKAFIPKGCREVSPEGISTHASRCACGQYDREVVLFLWKLPPYGNDAVVVYHAIGRGTVLPQNWESKQGVTGKKVINISDPVANADLLDPSGTFAGTERVMRVFCCILSEMQWNNINL